MKKIISIMLALALIFAMSAYAFASDYNKACKGDFINVNDAVTIRSFVHNN